MDGVIDNSGSALPPLNYILGREMEHSYGDYYEDFPHNVFFASLAAINEFGAVDLVFLMICLLLLVMGIINLGLLFKQIRILKSFSKEEMKEFLTQRMKKYAKK